MKKVMRITRRQVEADGLAARAGAKGVVTVERQSPTVEFEALDAQVSLAKILSQVQADTGLDNQKILDAMTNGIFYAAQAATWKDIRRESEPTTDKAAESRLNAVIVQALTDGNNARAMSLVEDIRKLGALAAWRVWNDAQ